MKKTISVLICITLFLSPFFAHAQFGTSLPFGGPITLVTQCTCSGNYLITVADTASNQLKNILVAPPISRLFQFFFFNVGQTALGTYTPGPQCIVKQGDKCVVVPTHGAIDSNPGAGSSGPVAESSGFGVPGGIDLAGLLKGVVSNLGQNVAQAFQKGGKQPTQSNVSKTLNPGRSISASGRSEVQRVRGVARNYFTPDEANFNSGEQVPIRDISRNVIAQADKRFVEGPGNETLAHEGVGVLRDGTVIVESGEVNGVPRYFVLEEGAGIGTGGRILEPFRSIAVDPNTIPLGTLVSIPETRGMVLPDGSEHNGVWRADQAGNGFSRYEIAFFIGTRGNRVFLDAEGISNQERLTIIILE